MITLIIHLFFVKIQFSIFHMIILLLLFGIQSLVIGIILAGITLRFRKTETLINSLNLLVMVLMVLPLLTISEKSMYLPSAICPLWGIVTYYQQLMERVDMVSVLKNLGFTVAHTIVFAVIANVIFSQYGKPEEIVKTPENDFVKEFILHQLEIKKNNIYSLFMVADAFGRAGTMPVKSVYSA